MEDDERSFGWQAYSHTELPTDVDVSHLSSYGERPHISPYVPDIGPTSYNAPFADTTFEAHIPEEPVFDTHQQNLSSFHTAPMEFTAQSAPQYVQPSLPRRKSRYLLRPLPGQVTHAAPTPEPHPYDPSSFPMQRWRNSPPQDEAASLSAIYNALQDHSTDASLSHGISDDAFAFRSYRGPSSAASYDSGASGSSVLSSTSDHSATSNTSHRIIVMKSRRRSRAPRKSTKKKSGDAVNRIFKCTFCCDTFRHRYDWVRHEKSLHLNLEEWKCAPHGPLVMRPSTGRMHCAYCGMLDPKPDHLDSHNHSNCHDDQDTPRIFRRKDHLVQHLRLVHRLEKMPLMEDWRFELVAVKSRCGFCSNKLNTWEERADHLATHFRKGKIMLDWQGDHGFDTSVASAVTNALPPYLIGSESLAPVPFSATNPASIDHFKRISSQIGQSAHRPLVPIGQGQDTNMVLDSNHFEAPSVERQQETVAFAEILTRHFSQFARQQMAADIVPTDEMFQRESRRVLYGDEDDAWNTTVADNADWLNSFREQIAQEKEPAVSGSG